MKTLDISINFKTMFVLLTRDGDKNVTEPINATEAPVNTWGLHHFKFTAYIVIGALLIFANTPIFVNILRHAVLRAKKEYLLLAGLAFADMLAGWGTLIAGAYRLKLISLNEENKQVNGLHCLGTPPFLLLVYSMTVQAGMLVILSVDRLIAVILPLKYVALTRAYSVYMIMICHLTTAVYVVVLIIYVDVMDSQTKTTMSALCIIPAVDGLFNSVFYIRLFLASLSVFIYATVWCLFRRYQRITVVSFPNAVVHLRRAQRHLTATVGIVAFLTFTFYVIPTALMFTRMIPDVWAPLYWSINCFNAIINVFVYSLRHEDIRAGLKLLFTGKELPSEAEKRLRRESKQSHSVTARAAILLLRYLDIVVPEPIFRNVRRISTVSFGNLT